MPRSVFAFMVLSFLAALALTGVSPAVAEETLHGWDFRIGVFAHDPGSPEKGDVDVNLEVVSSRLFAADPKWAAFVPRAHLGSTINTGGNTSHIHTGLTWTFDVTKLVFVEGSVGLALHDGENRVRNGSDRALLGCTWSFRESGSLGLRLTERLSAMGTIEHLSNAGLCEKNRGLTNFGVRLGYAF